MNRVVWLLCPLLAGCFLSSRGGDTDALEDDGSVIEDGGGHDDGGTDDCPNLGIYPSCDDLCESREECPGAGRCINSLDICVVPGDWPSRCVHDFDFPGSTGSNACSLPSQVCLQELEFSPELDDRESLHITGCVDHSFCTSPMELHPGHACYYSDLTRVETGPPAEACPANVSERWPFCGLECGGCRDIPEQSGYNGCVGLNDERGIGVCARGDSCTPGAFILDPEKWELFGEPEPIACLVLRDPLTDEYWQWGWPTGAATCRAYRERYPYRFDCRDFDWTSIE